LFLADFVLRMQSLDQIQQKLALAGFEADLRTWRQMLIGDGSLIAKMVAISYLQTDYLVLGDLIADRSIDLSPFSAELERLTTPFDLAD
jgi:hypothetical protein